MNKETQKILDEIEGFDSDKAELEELRREKGLSENLEKEIAILTQLFPELSADDIPDEVFEATDNGAGLAAEYALYYVKNLKKNEERKKTNEKNILSAPPEIKNHDADVFFTPEMVKKMSEDDIRRAYGEIMKSMEKWNKK